MAPATDTTNAKTEIPMAIHERIVGPLLRLLSISKRQSQCGCVPGRKPEISSATCSMDLRRNSSEYAIELSPEYLALCESRAEAYRTAWGMGGLLPDSMLRTDLTEDRFLAAFVVPVLVAEIRRLRPDVFGPAPEGVAAEEGADAV